MQASYHLLLHRNMFALVVVLYLLTQKNGSSYFALFTNFFHVQGVFAYRALCQLNNLNRVFGNYFFISNNLNTEKYIYF